MVGKDRVITEEAKNKQQTSQNHYRRREKETMRPRAGVIVRYKRVEQSEADRGKTGLVRGRIGNAGKWG